MNRTFLVLCVLPAFLTGTTFVPPAAVAQQPSPDITESDPAEAQKLEGTLIRRARQLTFEGRRGGESYFSADGQKMIFQSEREPGNPFFQIYLMDLETGDTQRVSPGTGKTTCAWIHPSGGKVLFASTQDDPSAAQEQKDEQVRELFVPNLAIEIANAGADMERHFSFSKRREGRYAATALLQ